MSKLPHTKLASALAQAASLLTVLIMAGCPSPDPEAQLSDFLKDTKEERDAAMGVRMDVSGALADISGTHLFALSAVIDRAHPLQFIATVELMSTAEGGTMTIQFQPLSLEMGSTTEPREPVGELLTLPETMVDAGGGFAVDLGEVMVTGMANPITGGDIVATLTIEGAIQSEDLWCGTVDGMATSPISLPLAGSTFAATRIEATDAASLPTEVVYACPAGGDEGGETDTDSDTATGG